MGKNQKRTSFQAAVSAVCAKKMKKVMDKSWGRGLPEPVSQVLMDEKAI